METFYTEKEICDLAIRIQDACNPIAVSEELNQVMRSLSRLNCDHARIEKYPAVILLLDKLCDLCGYNDSRFEAGLKYSNAYQECQNMVNNGKFDDV